MLVNSLLKLKNVIKSKYLNDVIVDYGEQTFQFPYYFTFRRVCVDDDYIARPDKLANDSYGIDQYGDLLCKINDIPNPFELNTGDIISIPSIDYITDFMIYNQSSDEDISTPQSKQKNTKRKASDSVVGDARFKIDNTKRIVIY